MPRRRAGARSALVGCARLPLSEGSAGAAGERLPPRAPGPPRADRRARLGHLARTGLPGRRTWEDEAAGPRAGVRGAYGGDAEDAPGLRAPGSGVGLGARGLRRLPLGSQPPRAGLLLGGGGEGPAGRQPEETRVPGAAPVEAEGAPGTGPGARGAGTGLLAVRGPGPAPSACEPVVGSALLLTEWPRLFLPPAGLQSGQDTAGCPLSPCPL